MVEAVTERGKIHNYFNKIAIPKEWKETTTIGNGGGMRKRMVEPEGGGGSYLDQRRTKSRCLTNSETGNPENNTKFGGFKKIDGGKIPNLERILEGGDSMTDDFNGGLGIIDRSKEEIKREDSLGESDQMTMTINTQG